MHRFLHQHATISRLMCGLLCLAMWRGPVVWVHQHDDEATSPSVDMRLTGHLHRFHHDFADRGEASTWHLHVGLLRDLLADECPDDAPEERRTDEPLRIDEVRIGMSFVEAQSGRFLGSEWVNLTVPPAASPRDAESSPRGSFLQAHRSQPLHALLCVIRC